MRARNTRPSSRQVLGFARLLPVALAAGLLITGCQSKDSATGQANTLAADTTDQSAQVAQERAAAEAAATQAAADRTAAEAAARKAAADRAAATAAAAEAAKQAARQAAAQRAAAAAAAAAAASQQQSISQPASGGGTDPQFGTCREAKANGYGPYREGEDPEYDWYRDSDGDGVVCE